MTERRTPPDEPDELSPPDAEELASAAALARALDGGRAEPELPQDALETAALLRASAGTARLAERRRHELRSELLASLPARARRRQRWPSWLLPLLPAAGVAAAAVVLLRGEPRESASSSKTPSSQAEAASSSAPMAAPSSASSVAGASAEADGQRRLAAAARGAPLAESERSAQAPLAADARRALTGDITRDAAELRRDLLARADDGAVTRAYADLDAARSRPALEGARRTLMDLASTLEQRTDDDGRSIRQDLYCRLAETALRLGEPQTALEWTRRGLALDGQPTALLAQLEALEGDAWGALGDDERAARSYMRALNVHETLLDEDLDGE